jgi:hypothetical protein
MDVFFCMKSHKNVLGHTNCYTVKLNRHTDKFLVKTFFYSLSVFLRLTVKSSVSGSRSGPSSGSGKDSGSGFGFGRIRILR